MDEQWTRMLQVDTCSYKKEKAGYKGCGGAGVAGGVVAGGTAAGGVAGAGVVGEIGRAHV